MQRESNADVAIIGADLAGPVAAAILTKHGRRVVILEHADTVGGRSGAVQTAEGYWIDFGHRDAHGVGDCQFPWHHGSEAARAPRYGDRLSAPLSRRLRRVHRVECVSLRRRAAIDELVVGASAAPRAHVDGIEGLLRASATREAPAGIVDLSAYAGRLAAEKVLAQIG